MPEVQKELSAKSLYPSLYRKSLTFLPRNFYHGETKSGRTKCVRGTNGAFYLERLMSMCQRITGIPNQPFFTVKETCGLLKFGRTTFYREADAGRLGVTKNGRKTLVSYRSLSKYCENLIDETNAFRSKNPGRWS